MDAEEGIRVRARPSTWTEALIAGVYLTPTTGEDLQRVDEEPWAYIKSLFAPESFKRRNGWLAGDCLDMSLQHLFQFLSPIFYLESQSRITLSFAATVVFSLEQRQEINWTKILHKVIHNQVKNFCSRVQTGKLRYTNLTPYLAYIYYKHKCLLSLEKGLYHIHRGKSRREVEGSPEDQGNGPNTTLVALCELL